jgi:uncharacterized protein
VNLSVLLDTGPLVAFVDRQEPFNEWSRRVFERIDSPLLTCEAVLTEACFLVRHVKRGVEAVLGLVEHGFVAPIFRLEDEAAAVTRLLGRYASVPMSLADACLVRLSETRPDSLVLTLDRDFRLYRRHRREVIPVLMPEGR